MNTVPKIHRKLTYRLCSVGVRNLLPILLPLAKGEIPTVRDAGGFILPS